MEEFEAYFLLNNSFSMLLMALVVFAIKATIVWAYAGAAAPHVFTAELAQMWSILFATALFFTVLVFLMLNDEPVYRHAQNLIAYLAYSLGAVLYAALVVVDCAQSDPAVCMYLYPVSVTRSLEAAVGLALLSIHFITTLWSVMSLAFARRYVRTALAYGGVFYASSIVTTLFFVQTYNALESCPNDVALHSRMSGSTAMLFIVIGCAGVVAYAAPSLLAGQDPESRITWDDLQNRKKNDEAHNTKFFMAALFIGTVSAYVTTIFSMHFGLYQLGTGVASLTVTTIGAAAPITQWLRKWWARRRDGSGDDAPAAAAATAPQEAFFSAPRVGSMWGDNRRWPHLHKNV